MPTGTLHLRRHTLIGLGITAVALIAVAANSDRNPDDAASTRLPLVTASIHPEAHVPLPPINRAVPQQLPATTDPFVLTQHVSSTLWGTQPPDVISYQVMAAAGPDLRDPEVDQLTDVIDAELTSGPARVGRIDVVAATGIDEATTATVAALDQPRTLTMRIACTPECRLLGITR